MLPPFCPLDLSPVLTLVGSLSLRKGVRTLLIEVVILRLIALISLTGFTGTLKDPVVWLTIGFGTFLVRVWTVLSTQGTRTWPIRNFGALVIVIGSPLTLWMKFRACLIALVVMVLRCMTLISGTSVIGPKQRTLMKVLGWVSPLCRAVSGTDEAPAVRTVLGPTCGLSVVQSVRPVLMPLKTVLTIRLVLVMLVFLMLVSRCVCVGATCLGAPSPPVQRVLVCVSVGLTHPSLWLRSAILKFRSVYYVVTLLFTMLVLMMRIPETLRLLPPFEDPSVLRRKKICIRPCVAGALVSPVIECVLVPSVFGMPLLRWC